MSDLSESLNSVIARTADLNRTCIRVMERGWISSDAREDMIFCADLIKDIALRLPGRPTTANSVGILRSNAK